MSIKLMSAVWDLELKPISKLLLLALADNANDQGVCWPSISHIMKKTSLARRTVETNLQVLISLNLIQSENRYKNNGSLMSNCYTITLPQHLHYPPQEMRDPPAGDAYKPSIKPSLKNNNNNITKKSDLVNYKPSDRIKELAKQKGWKDPDLVLDEFKDYYLAHGKTLKDVEAALRNWLRRDKKYTMDHKESRNGRQNNNSKREWWDNLETRLNDPELYPSPFR